MVFWQIPIKAAGTFHAKRTSMKGEMTMGKSWWVATGKPGKKSEPEQNKSYFPYEENAMPNNATKFIWVTRSKGVVNQGLVPKRKPEDIPDLNKQ
jgi:hypothetical protein